MGDGKELPRVHDERPPAWTGVPVERDPRTGRRIGGSPGGRGDKQQSGGRRLVRAPWLLAAGGAVLVVGAGAAFVLLGSGDAEPDATAATGTSSSTASGTADQPGDPEETTGAPVDTGPREVVVETTITAAEAAPGVEPGGNGFPSVGDVRTSTWVLTGPCDGQGACTVEECVDATTCLEPKEFTPTGSGYTGTFESSLFGRPWPECGSIRTLIEFALTEVGDSLEVAGTYQQTSGAPLGQNGTEFCSITVYDGSFASA